MFAPLRFRPFKDLWLGQAISQLGDAFYFIVFMYMTQQVTGSAGQVGVVGAAETIPFLLFGPQAGVVADRYDRRWTMLLSDLGSGLTLLLFAVALALGYHPGLGILVVVTFALSSMRAFFNPAKTAAIPRLVPTSDVMAANALSNATRNVMQLVGLSLSGGVVAYAYALSPNGFFATAMGLNALSFLGSAFYIFRLPQIEPETKKDLHAWDDFREGLRYVRGRRDLKTMIAMLALFRLFVAPFFVFYLAANKEWLGDKPANLLWMEFVFFAGMLASSAAMAKTKPDRPAVWFCLGLAFTGVAVGAMAFCRTFATFAAWNIVAGLAIPVADIPIGTYLQTSVPDAFRGRVAAVESAIATGAMPVGMALGGILAERLGIAGGFLTMGVGMTVACLLGLMDGGFRRVRMPAAAL